MQITTKRYLLDKCIILEITSDSIFKKLGCIVPEKTVPRITTFGSNNSSYTPGHRVRQRLDGMCRDMTHFCGLLADQFSRQSSWSGTCLEGNRGRSGILVN
ncbi:hypothetical protein TNCV_3205721 [Trichonephila clavipes]|nr:hypothetical protein TNCV_3205721 [Trichonephila clavipes]